jgi:hypothetical protein
VDVSYQPMTLADLARFVAGEAEFDVRWRLVVEFLKEYHQEPAGMRPQLLAGTPPGTGDVRWDALLAGLAENLAMRDGNAAPHGSPRAMADAVLASFRDGQPKTLFRECVMPFGEISSPLDKV